MEELRPDQFERVLPLFQGGVVYRALPLAVIHGRQQGRIFVDRVQAPRAAYVANISGMHHIAGSVAESDFNRSLSQIILERVDHPFGWCVLVPGAEEWHAVLDEVLDKDGIKASETVCFEFDPARFSFGDWRNRIPSGFTIKAVDGALVDRLGDQYSVFKTWGSAPGFLANGFGYCLLKGDDIASVAFAYSAAVPEGYVELAIRTGKGYRRRGLATVVCSAFIEHCLRAGLAADWHTQSTNAGSIALAKKLGYRLLAPYRTYTYMQSAAEV